MKLFIIRAYGWRELAIEYATDLNSEPAAKQLDRGSTYHGGTRSCFNVLEVLRYRFRGSSTLYTSHVFFVDCFSLRTFGQKKILSHEDIFNTRIRMARVSHRICTGFDSGVGCQAAERMGRVQQGTRPRIGGDRLEERATGIDPAPSGYHRRVSRRTLAGRIKYLPVSEWVGTYFGLIRDLLGVDSYHIIEKEFN